MKIAFITSGNPNNRKGFFNNVQERADRLAKAYIEGLSVDFYMIRHRDSLLFSLMRRKRRSEMHQTVNVDGIIYNNLWVKHSFIDYLRYMKFKLIALMDMKHISAHKTKLKDYDLIMAHGPDANYLAYDANKVSDVPYITSWHGSDINVMPVQNNKTKKLFKEIIDGARSNLFVSKRLLETSNYITKSAKKEVLYTGPADRFVCQSEEEITKTKVKYGVGKNKIVGFIGNLVAIKNIKSLPIIFKNIAAFDPDIHFWIIGNGEQESPLREGLESIIDQCRFFGKVDPSDIPDLMNAMDLLVLPSLNEGLPRVTLEALACEVPIVGSDVGGIPEVIGTNNVFRLDNDFERNISNRAIEILKNNEPAMPFPAEFSWENAIEKLERIIKEAVI